MPATAQSRSRFMVLLLAGATLVACSVTAPSDPEPAAPSPSGSAPLALTTALLPAGAMPAWNGQPEWAAVATQDPRPLGLCELADPPGAVGATEFYAGAGLTGVNTLWLFDQPGDATQATAALTQDLAECDAGGSGKGRVARIATLPSGSTWVASAPAGGDDTTFDFVGIAARGRIVSLVGFTLVGQDANYEKDPLADSVQASLDRVAAVMPAEAGPAGP